MGCAGGRPGAARALRTPLLLSLFADAYRHTSAADLRALRGVHSGDLRDRIFAAYVQRRYEWEARKAKAHGAALAFTLEQVYDVLGKTAMGNAAHPFATENIFRQKDLHIKPQREAFAQVAAQLNLIAPVNAEDAPLLGEQAQYRFIHLLLRDFFAFRYALAHLTDPAEYDALIVSPPAALGKLGDTRALDPLLAALAHDSERIRSRAAYGLGRLGDARAVDALLRALNDPVHNVKRAAIEALGRLGDARAVPPLLAHFRGDNATLRQYAANALVRLGRPAVLALRDLLDHPDAEMRAGVVLLLGMMGDHEVADTLLRLLEEVENNLFLGSVISALGALREGRAVEPLLKMVTKTTYSPVISVIVETLGVLGDARAVEPLLTLLQTGSTPLIRSNAASALGELGAAAAVPLLAAITRDGAEPALVRGAADALTRFNTPEAREAELEWRAYRRRTENRVRPERKPPQD